MRITTALIQVSILFASAHQSTSYASPKLCKDLFTSDVAVVSVLPETALEKEISKGSRVTQIDKQIQNQEIVEIINSNPQLQICDYVQFLTWQELETISRDENFAKRIVKVVVNSAGGRIAINRHGETPTAFRLQYTYKGLQLIAKILLTRREGSMPGSLDWEASYFGMSKISAEKSWRFDRRPPGELKADGGFFPNNNLPSRLLPEHSLVSSTGSNRFVSITLARNNLTLAQMIAGERENLVRKKSFQKTATGMERVLNPKWSDEVISEIQSLAPDLDPSKIETYSYVYEYEIADANGFLPLKLPGSAIKEEQELISTSIPFSQIRMYRKHFVLGVQGESINKIISTEWKPTER